MKSKFKWVLLTLMTAGASTASAASFSGMVSFGDSLSDVGNIYALTSALHPSIPSIAIVPGAPGYYQGRFSNGPIWIDQLAGLLNLSPPSPSATGGNDYAYGDATSAGGYTNTLIPNIQTQISSWSSSQTAGPSQLFTVLGGANDLLDALGSGQTSSQQTAAAQQAALNIATGVQTLYNDGARHILVGNLPDFGLLPSYRGSAQQSLATSLTNSFNATLATQLAQIQGASTGLSLYSLDVNGLFNDLINNPSAYNLTNVTDSAYTGDTDFIGDGTSVADPSGYLFWDREHPTTTGHMLLAQAAYAVVPEPTCAIFMLAALSVLRRRSSARHS